MTHPAVAAEMAATEEAVIPPSENWLCFKANENNCSISTTVAGSLTTTPSLEYSKDRTTWEPFIINSTSVDLPNNGDKVYIRATGSNATFSETSSKWIKFVISGSVSASGNIMSLLDKNCGGNSVPEWAFYRLFYGNSTLTTAPKLPATTLAERCYAYMFCECDALTTAPELTATDLENGCYAHMFANCINLNSITVHFGDWDNAFTSNWVYVVPSGGTFICPAGLPEEYGDSRIPTGWTVQHPSTP